LVAEALGGGASVLAFDAGIQLGGNFEELAVAGLPDFEKGAGVETAFDGTSLIEAIFEGLADEVFLQALTAGVLQNAGQPV
jgi:urea transporter